MVLVNFYDKEEGRDEYRVSRMLGCNHAGLLLLDIKEHMKLNFFRLVYHKETQKKTYLMFISKYDPQK